MKKSSLLATAGIMLASAVGIAPSPARPRHRKVFDEATRLRRSNTPASHAKYRHFMITSPWSEIIAWNRKVVANAEARKNLSARRIDQLNRDL